MKKTHFWILTLVVLSLLTFGSLTAFAQTRLEGHTDVVNSLTFSPDGKTLASGSRDTKIRLWEADTGKYIRTTGSNVGIHRMLRVHTSSVSSIAFNPDGSRLASGSRDGTIRLWNAATGKHLATLRGHTDYIYSIAFSPDGSRLASGSGDDTIRLWDATTSEHLSTLEGHTDVVYRIAFSPDGSRLASGSLDSTIRLWDGVSGELMATLRGHTKYVLSIAFSPDGSRLASMSGDRTIRLWDGTTGEHLSTLGGHGYSVNSVAFSPDGSRLASGNSDDTIRLWNAATGKHLSTLEGHTDSVSSVAFSPDGSRLASGSLDSTIRLWDGVSGELMATLEGHTSSVYRIAFSPNGSRLASVSEEKTIRLWDGVSGAHLATLERHTDDVIVAGIVRDIVFSPDGTTLASVSPYRTIRLWDIDLIRPLVSQGHTGSVNSVSFSPDGQMLASGSDDRTIHLWEVSTGIALRIFTGHTGSVNSVSFSPDGQTLVSGSSDETIRLWDVTTGNLLATLKRHTGSVNSVSFSPDGQMLASGSSDGTVRLWDTATGAYKQTLNSEHTVVYSIAFSPDGRTLVSGGRDGSYDQGWIASTIRLWDVLTGAHKQTFKGAGEYVNSVSFSPDGLTLASGAGESGYIRLLDVATGRHLRNFYIGRESNNVNSVAFSPNGEKLAADSFNTIRIWKLTLTRVSLDPFPVVSPAIGEQLTVNVNIVAGENVSGYQVSLSFDSTALRYVKSANGDYLPPGAFFVPPVVTDNKVTLGASSLAGESNGDGALATVTFEVLDVKESVIDLFDTILTNSDGEHLPQLPLNTKVVEPSLLPTDAIISLTPSSVLSPAIGEQLTFNIDIADGQNVKDFALGLDFDQSALKYISSGPGNYLVGGVGNGGGTLRMVTFEVLAVKASTVSLSGYLVQTNGFRYVPTFKSAEVVVPLFGDVNRDGIVNIQDLVLVGSSFTQRVIVGGNPADVNEDGVVDIVDLVKVAGAINDGAAAPSTWNLETDGTITREQVQKWLSEAQQLSLTDATSQRGILFFEQLLAALTPKETRLLANYPNPFNPETWIPYQLAKSADVKISIYAADGKLVRVLDLGHQPVGLYQHRSRAAYWDGKNALGESVASGVYFYTLKAGNFTATRKMLIRK